VILKSSGRPEAKNVRSRELQPRVFLWEIGGQESSAWKEETPKRSLLSERRDMTYQKRVVITLWNGGGLVKTIQLQKTG